MLRFDFISARALLRAGELSNNVRIVKVWKLFSCD
jgi:hypothetical protein